MPESLENLIMKFADFEKIKQIFPHILYFKAGPKELLFFGGRHTFNPDDKQYGQIKNEFEKFKPEVVFWEGKINIDLTSENIAKKNGEGTYLIYLANKYGIPNETLDVPVEGDIAMQLKKYPKEAVFTFFSIRPMHTFKSSGIGEQEAVQNLSAMMDSWRREVAWPDFDFSLENLQKLFKQYTGENLLFNPAKYNRKLTSPDYNSNILNEIWRSSNKFRDSHTLNFLISKFRQYDKIFALMGGSHAYILEPALKAWFESV